MMGMCQVEQRDAWLAVALCTEKGPRVPQAGHCCCQEATSCKTEQAKLLREKKLITTQRKCANALTCLDMFHSPACWRTAAQARKQFVALRSKTARLAAVKEQHRIRTVGFGWKDLHCPWSKGGTDHSLELLWDHLIGMVISEQRKRRVPDMPPMDMPSQQKRQQLGAQMADVAFLDKACTDKAKEFRRGGKRLREETEASGDAGRCGKMQPPKPKVDETLIDARIEQHWEFTERSGKVVGMWCKGVVVDVVKGNQVCIE